MVSATIVLHVSPGDAVDFEATNDIIRLSYLETRGGEARFDLQLSEPEEKHTWPFIPCYIYRADTLRVVTELHRAHRLSETRWLGISKNIAETHVPADVELRLQRYWAGDEGFAVLLGPEKWQETSTSILGDDHDHDLFDWATISPRSMPTAWYNKFWNWWCTKENFEKFIRDDVLGWRSDPETAGPLPDPKLERLIDKYRSTA